MQVSHYFETVSLTCCLTSFVRQQPADTLHVPLALSLVQAFFLEFYLWNLKPGEEAIHVIESTIEDFSRKQAF